MTEKDTKFIIGQLFDETLYSEEWLKNNDEKKFWQTESAKIEEEEFYSNIDFLRDIGPLSRVPVHADSPKVKQTQRKIVNNLV